LNKILFYELLQNNNTKNIVYVIICVIGVSRINDKIKELISQADIAIKNEDFDKLMDFYI